MNGLMSGKGKFLFEDDSVYEGELLNGKFHGFGVLTTKKFVYEGNWENNQKNGYGEYIYNDDWIFKGYYKNDKRNGEGILYDSEKVIKSEWINGRQSLK